jgi:hypothetical protein
MKTDAMIFSMIICYESNQPAFAHEPPTQNTRTPALHPRSHARLAPLYRIQCFTYVSTKLYHLYLAEQARSAICNGIAAAAAWPIEVQPNAASVQASCLSSSCSVSQSLSALQSILTCYCKLLKKGPSEVKYCNRLQQHTSTAWKDTRLLSLQHTKTLYGYI